MVWDTKYKSLRFRLTFWNILAFLLVTLLSFFGFYIVTRKILLIHTDNLLRSHSAQVVTLISGNGVGMHSMLTREAFNREFSEIPGMLVVAMDNKGQIFNASVTLNRDATTFADLFTRVYGERKQFITDKNISGSAMRFLATPILDAADNLQGVVLVAHPIDVIAKSLESLILVLGVTFLIIILPVTFGGYFLIKKAVEPIAVMSEKLKKINFENLDERMVVSTTRDEVAELAQTFNLLLDRLHAAFVRERQFIGDIAHELKTPLSTVRSNIEVILSKPRSNIEYKHALEETLIDNAKMSTTLRHVLDLAWSESQDKNKLKLLELAAVLEDIKDIAVKMSLPKNILLISKITPNIQILGKFDKLGQAILNLVDNAIKFTPENGKVFLNLTRHGSFARLQIKDNGRGISESDLPHIFERFYRGSRSEKISGSGLGLAIANSIIHAHLGEIKVKSKVGKGSIFTIILPLIKSS